MGVIWALARNTIAQAVRMKAAAVLIALFVACSALLPFALEADSTLTGLVKVILTYSVTLAGVLLLVLTLLLSASVLGQEIEGKQIYILAAKPVHRWQLLAGKWLGIVALDAALLLVMGLVTLVNVHYISGEKKFDESARRDLYEQVLTRRTGVRPRGFDLEEQSRLIKEDLIAQGMEAAKIDTQAIRVTLERQLEKNTIKISPAQRRTFTLSGLPVFKGKQNAPDKNGAQEASGSKLTVRYKVYAIDSSKAPLFLGWRFFRPSDGAYVETTSRIRDGEFREFQIPAEVVDDKGTLLVEVNNLTLGNPQSAFEDERKPHEISLSLKEGLEVLAPSGAFWHNFFCALLLLFIRLATLAAIGVAASAYLHFPVAALLLIAVVTTGYLRTFMDSAIERSVTKTQAESAAPKPGEEINPVTQTLAGARDAVIFPALRKVILRIPANFEDTDPVPDLIVGRSISWLYLAQAAFWNLILRGGLCFLLGVFLLYRRELGLPEG